jgi:hypothetical protein
MKKLENFIYLTFHLLINLDNFDLGKFFQNYSIWEIANLAQISKSGKSVKRNKVVNYRLLQKFHGASDHKYQGCVFTIGNVICGQYKKKYSSSKIYFYKWQKLFYGINCTNETSTKRGNFFYYNES